MHSLRSTYRRALQGTVSMQKIRVGSERAHSTESTTHAARRKSKEERFRLVMQFVTKYKASNNGKLPGMSLLRKEVGGKYEILKEILHDIKTDQEKLEMEIPAGGTKGLPRVLDYSWRREPVPANVLEKEKKLVSGMGKITEIKKDYNVVDSRTDAKTMEQRELSITSVKDDNVADSRTAAKAMEQREQSMTSDKDDSQLIMDISGGIDEDHSDSDVAASEYQYTLPQMVNLSKVASKKMEPLREFCLLVTGVPAFTTCADLRAAFEDCGGVLNAYVSKVRQIQCFKTQTLDRCAAINFKTEEGLKAAMMKEKVLLRGQLFDLKKGYQTAQIMACDVKQAKVQYCASKTEAQQNRLDFANDVNHEPGRHLQVDGDFGFEGKASASTRRSQRTTVLTYPRMSQKVS